MPLSLRRGTVTSVIERHEELIRLEVDGIPAIAYPRVTGPVEEGDDVLVNTQARDLGLGSGGFDVVYANLTRGLELPSEGTAHVMKLPYAPGQFASLHAEESGETADALNGMPVVCCSLHSQIAPVCAGLGTGVRIAYLQLPGGALPVSLSDTIRALKERGLVETAVAVGACFDGDVACVNVASALAWTASESYDAAVCAIGPGIVGTGSRLGHGGIAAAEVANAALALGGSPILCVRASSADPRDRHRGVSHHTRAVLELVLGEVTVAWPDQSDTDSWEEACAGLPLSHMGRSPADDPAFFAAAFAAGRLARDVVAPLSA